MNDLHFPGITVFPGSREPSAPWPMKVFLALLPFVEMLPWRAEMPVLPALLGAKLSRIECNDAKGATRCLASTIKGQTLIHSSFSPRLQNITVASLNNP